MSKLLEGKPVVLGVWNKWALSMRSRRHSSEGATALLTYQNDRAKNSRGGKKLGAKVFCPCDVQQQSDIDNLAAAAKAQGHKLALSFIVSPSQTMRICQSSSTPHG